MRIIVPYAQANPGKLNFGSILHLAGELFNDLAKTKTYKSSGQAMNDRQAPRHPRRHSPA